MLRRSSDRQPYPFTVEICARLTAAGAAVRRREAGGHRGRERGPPPLPPAVLANLARGPRRAKRLALEPAWSGRVQPHHHQRVLMAEPLGHSDARDEAIQRGRAASA